MSTPRQSGIAVGHNMVTVRFHGLSHNELYVLLHENTKVGRFEFADVFAERDDAQKVCAEAYQVVGSLLSDVGAFETQQAQKVLDNLSQHKPVHDDVLPWPSFVAERGQPGEQA